VWSGIHQFKGRHTGNIVSLCEGAIFQFLISYHFRIHMSVGWKWVYLAISCEERVYQLEEGALTSPNTHEEGAVHWQLNIAEDWGFCKSGGTPVFGKTWHKGGTFYRLSLYYISLVFFLKSWPSWRGSQYFSKLPTIGTTKGISTDIFKKNIGMILMCLDSCALKFQTWEWVHFKLGVHSITKYCPFHQWFTAVPLSFCKEYTVLGKQLITSTIF